jgi:hypothetical protein
MVTAVAILFPRAPVGTWVKPHTNLHIQGQDAASGKVQEKCALFSMCAQGVQPSHSQPSWETAWLGVEWPQGVCDLL